MKTENLGPEELVDIFLRNSTMPAEREGHAVLDSGMVRSALAGKGIREAKNGNTPGPIALTLFYATDFADRLENEIIPALRAGFALVPHAIHYLRAEVHELVRRLVLVRGAFEYWESGMDMRFGTDMHRSFVRHRARLVRERIAPRGATEGCTKRVMEVYILRRGIAENRRPGQLDAERRLAAQGRDKFASPGAACRSRRWSEAVSHPHQPSQEGRRDGRDCSRGSGVDKSGWGTTRHAAVAAHGEAGRWSQNRIRGRLRTQPNSERLPGAANCRFQGISTHT
jgi:hypothetical protein